MGRKFANFLNIQPIPPVDGYNGKTKREDANTTATSAFAHQGEPDEIAFVWVMYEELREALSKEGYL